MSKSLKAATYETHGNPAEVLRVAFKSSKDDRKTWRFRGPDGKEGFELTAGPV